MSQKEVWEQQQASKQKLAATMAKGVKPGMGIGPGLRNKVNNYFSNQHKNNMSYHENQAVPAMAPMPSHEPTLRDGVHTSTITGGAIPHRGNQVFDRPMPMSQEQVALQEQPPPAAALPDYGATPADPPSHIGPQPAPAPYDPSGLQAGIKRIANKHEAEALNAAQIAMADKDIAARGGGPVHHVVGGGVKNFWDGLGKIAGVNRANANQRKDRKLAIEERRAGAEEMKNMNQAQLATAQVGKINAEIAEMPAASQRANAALGIQQQQADSQGMSAEAALESARATSALSEQQIVKLQKDAARADKKLTTDQKNKQVELVTAQLQNFMNHEAEARKQVGGELETNPYSTQIGILQNRLNSLQGL